MTDRDVTVEEIRQLADNYERIDHSALADVLRSGAAQVERLTADLRKEREVWRPVQLARSEQAEARADAAEAERDALREIARETRRLLEPFILHSTAERDLIARIDDWEASMDDKAMERRGSYGFTCGYCDAGLDTPFDDARRAERFAHDQGWRLTFGRTKRWGDGANVTCHDCIAPGEEALPLCDTSDRLARTTPERGR